ncbi:MAG: hypothetical protein WAV66_07955, partial [Anaerolineae bacterium]
MRDRDNHLQPPDLRFQGTTQKNELTARKQPGIMIVPDPHPVPPRAHTHERSDCMPEKDAAVVAAVAKGLEG